MKKLYTVIISILFVSTAIFAQEEEKTVDRPVSEAFFCGDLLDAQTTTIFEKGTIDMAIQHKFGTLENGRSDIWGIYSSANIRLSVDYVPYKNLQVGYGLNRSSLTHDLNVKYTIFEQTRKNTMPVALGVYGNIGLSGNPDADYGSEYKFGDRLSYFGEVMVGRKFNDRMTFQVAASFSHFNFANRANFDFDRIGLHALGRIKVTGMGSLIFNYDQPLKTFQLSEHSGTDLEPNVSIGWEIATVTHSFQIYLGRSKEILPQFMMVHETKSGFEIKQFNIGFVITHMWE